MQINGLLSCFILLSFGACKPRLYSSDAYPKTLESGWTGVTKCLGLDVSCEGDEYHFVRTPDGEPDEVFCRQELKKSDGTLLKKRERKILLSEFKSNVANAIAAAREINR